MAELFGFTIARKKTEDEQKKLPSIVSPTDFALIFIKRYSTSKVGACAISILLNVQEPTK